MFLSQGVLEDLDAAYGRSSMPALTGLELLPNAVPRRARIRSATQSSGTDQRNVSHHHSNA